MKRSKPHYCNVIRNLKLRTQNSAYHSPGPALSFSPSKPGHLYDHAYDSCPQAEALIARVKGCFQSPSSVFLSTCQERAEACSYFKVKKIYSKGRINPVVVLINTADPLEYLL